MVMKHGIEMVNDIFQIGVVMIKIKKQKKLNNLTYINNELAHGVYVDEYGNMFWYQNGKKHRNNDKPSIIYTNGTMIWYKYGILHRNNDKPAIVLGNGDRYWYQNGVRHRDGNKPAITYNYS
jgi:hypothetical protein